MEVMTVACEDAANVIVTMAKMTEIFFIIDIGKPARHAPALLPESSRTSRRARLNQKRNSANKCRGGKLGPSYRDWSRGSF